MVVVRKVVRRMRCGGGAGQGAVSKVLSLFGVLCYFRQRVLALRRRAGSTVVMEIQVTRSRVEGLDIEALSRCAKIPHDKGGDVGVGVRGGEGGGRTTTRPCE